MSAIYRRGHAEIEANLTPLIDVTFLLIVFFVLVSQIVEAENVPMDLPAPDDPLSHVVRDPQRVVINILPAPGGTARGYRIGTETIPATDAGLVTLRQQMTRTYSNNPQVQVNLRADRSTQYEWIAAAMRAISQAAQAAEADQPIVPRVNLAITAEQ